MEAAPPAAQNMTVMPQQMAGMTGRPTAMMPFMDAIKTCFNKYADFDGRASRSEYWWFSLFLSLRASRFRCSTASLFVVFEWPAVFGTLFNLAVFIPCPLRAVASLPRFREKRNEHAMGAHHHRRLLRLLPHPGRRRCGPQPVRGRSHQHALSGVADAERSIRSQVGVEHRFFVQWKKEYAAHHVMVSSASTRLRCPIGRRRSPCSRCPSTPPFPQGCRRSGGSTSTRPPVHRSPWSRCRGCAGSCRGRCARWCPRRR